MWTACCAPPLSVRLDQVFRRPMDRQFFDPVALFWLQKLVRRTGAQVVLSSSWRYALEDGDLFTGRILQNLYDCLAAHGAPVAGIAPILGVSKGGRDRRLGHGPPAGALCHPG